MSHDRIKTWERNLLDLSMANNLLHLRPSARMVEISEPDIQKMLATLKAGRLHEIVGRKEPEPGTDSDNDNDNEQLLKELYRASRSALEENGTNNLFVSVGTLEWFDQDEGERHLAPLLLIPVSIARTKAKTYEIKLRGEEALFNFTLLEYLQQTFGVSLSEFFETDVDDDGIPDWETIFARFSEHVDAINAHQPADKKWTMPLKSYIGIFSFTKFLMWNDLHSTPEVVTAHPILGCLIDNSIPSVERLQATAASLEEEKPIGHILPVDYDSSQLEAVVAGAEGESFVLHGPPGTGKSQTITNLIADALFHGKKVLFVAEKRAALEVVQKRLAAIGLSPFCLELHSNKTNKKSFFAQLQNSYMELITQSQPSQPLPESFHNRGTELFGRRSMVKGLAEAMHRTRSKGLSLFEIIERAIAIPGEAIKLSNDEALRHTPAEIDAACETLAELDQALEIYGTSFADAPLRGLYPHENTSANEDALKALLPGLPAFFLKAEKTHLGWFNRLIMRRSPARILANKKTWLSLNELAVLDPDLQNATSLSELIMASQRWDDGRDGLRKWYHVASRIIKSGILADGKAVLDFLAAGHSGAETAHAFKKGYYLALAAEIIGSDTDLRGFNGSLFRSVLDNYRDCAEEFQEIRTETLRVQLLNLLKEYKLPKELEKEQLLLSKRMSTGGRGLSLRRIITDSFHVVSETFPCMMMSPISVAQYLEMKPGIFDIIIFDEASQMSTADAVGAIARGGSLIVVGDPKQLPPTRFFTATPGAETEDTETDDADSILEDCIALGLPSRYLSRHYRSRHESLIAFSNRHFYGNKLMTFPSVNDRDKKVWLVDPHGVYDYGATRTNAIEARAVVDKVLQLLDKPEAPSVGVVTFSKAQADMIEDILYAKLSRNKHLREVAENGREPLFIKNLESVQGDERDIILFSVGYGPDSDGKVSMNFGPINRRGGERRLNVAASRAREEMIVFSSLKASHIKADAQLGKGAMALRAFLEYAETGVLEAPEKGSDVEILVREIARELSDAGWNVDMKVGRSDFNIDVAVRNPRNPDNYILGIVVDGRNYAAMPTARDREITAPDVLKGLGWNIHRVYAIDWLDNRDLVMKGLLDDLASISPSSDS